MGKGSNATIEDTVRLVLDATGFREELGNVKRSIEAIANNLSKGLGGSFKTSTKDAQNLGKVIGKTIVEELKKVGHAADENLDFSKKTKESTAGIKQVVHQLEIAASALDAINRRTASIDTRSRAIEARQRTARQNVQEQTRQQRFKLDAIKQVETEKRITDGLRFEQRKQVENLKQADSITRIQEQASQQRRLAKWTQFYKTIGAFGQRFGEEMASTAGQTIRKIIFREKDGLNQRESMWRRGNQSITNVEEQGNRSRLNLLGRYFDKRRQVVQQGIEKEQRLLSQKNLGSQALNTNLNSGVLGATVGSTTLGSLGGAAAGAGIGAAFIKAFNVSSDFGAAMEILKVASGATADQIERVKKASIEFGNDVTLPGLSAADAADAFRILAVSGIDVETSLRGAAKGVLQLSRAAKVDAGDAAKSVAAAINVFKLKGDDAQAVADGLSVALTQSGASLAEMNDAIKQTGLSFANKFLKVDGPKKTFNEMNAVLATFAKNGLRGSDAGTSLKTMLQFLNGKSEDAIGLLQDLTKAAGETGTVMFDAKGNTRSFADTIRILRDGINKLPTDAKRSEVISKVFGTDASRAAEVLAALNDQDLPKLIKMMEKSGSAADLASAQNQGFKRGLDALSSTIETISLKLAPLGTLVGDALAGVSGFLTKLADGQGVWKAIRGALAGIGIALGSIIAAKGAVEVFKLLGTASRVLMASPFGILAVTLAAIGGAVGYIISVTPGLGGALGKLGGVIKKAVVGPLEALGTLMETVIGFATTLAGKVLPNVIGMFESFVGLLTSGFAGKSDENGVAGVIQRIGRFAADAQEALFGLADAIGGVFSGTGSILSKLGAAGGFLANAIDVALGGVPGKVAASLKSAYEVVRQFAEESIIGPVTRFFESVRQLWRDSFGNDQSFIEGTLSFINGAAKRIGRTLTAIVTDPTLLKAVAALLVSAAAIALSAISGLISGVVEKLIDRLGSMLENIPFFGPLLGQLADFGKSLSDIITFALIAGFAFSKLKGPLGKLSGEVSKTFRGVGAARFAADPLAVRQLKDVRAQAARDIAAQTKATNAARNRRGLPALDADSAAQTEKLVRQRLEQTVGAKRASQLLAAEARALADKQRLTDDKFAAQQRRANVAQFGVIGGGLANTRASLDRASQSVRKFWGTFTSPETRRRVIKALDYVAPVSRVASAIERVRKQSELASLKSLDAATRSRIAKGGLAPNARIRTLETELAAPVSRTQGRFNAAAEAAAATAQSIKLGIATGVARAQMDKLFKKPQSAERTKAVAALRKELMSLPASTSLVGKALGKLSVYASGPTNVFTNIARKVGGLEVPIGKFGKAFQKVFGEKVFDKASDSFTRTGGAFQKVFGEKVPKELGRMNGAIQKVFGTKVSIPILDEFDRKIGETQKRVGGATQAISKRFRESFGEGREGVSNAVQTAEAALAGFFSGKALAGEGLTSKITGVVGSIASIGGAFAVGGPIAAGIAAISTAFGYIVGNADKAKEAVKEFQQLANDAADALTETVKSGGTASEQAAERAVAFLKKNRSAIEKFAQDIPSIAVDIKAAIDIAGTTGDLEAAIAEIRRKVVAKFGTFKEDNIFLNNLVGTSGQSDALLTKGVTRRILKILGASKAQLKSNSAASGFLDDTLADPIKGKGRAERIAAELQAALLQGVEDGLIPARDALDRFVVESSGDGFYEITRLRIKGLGDAQVDVLNSIFGEIRINSSAYDAQEGSVAGVIKKTNEALDAERERGKAILDQNDSIDAQKSKYDKIKGVVGDILDRVERRKNPTKDKDSARLGVQEAITGIIDALKGDNGAIGSFMKSVGADTPTGSAVRGAQEGLGSAWSDVVATVLADPKNVKNKEAWEKFGKQALTEAKLSIFKNARDKGMSPADAQALIDSLNVPEFVDIQPDLLKIDDAVIQETLGDASGKIETLWDASGPKLEIPVGFNPKDIEAVRVIAEALGIRVTTANSGRGGQSGRGGAPPPGFPGAPRTSVPSGGGGSSGSSPSSGGVPSLSQFKETVRNARDKNMPFKRIKKEELAFVKNLESIRDNPAVFRMIDFFNRRGGHIGGYAYGDVVNKPTLGIFGEAGPEVILPLSKPGRMIELLIQSLTKTKPLPNYASGGVFAGGTSAASVVQQLGSRTEIHEGDIHIYESRSPRATARAAQEERRSARFRGGQVRAR